MSESKEYVSRSDELGNIHISEEVLAAITAAAALEVEGVNSLSANLGSDLAELLGKKNLTKGIRIQMEEEKVRVELSILMDYGHTIPEMGRAVQDGVKAALESMTGLEVAEVSVTVSGISFEKSAR
ncbi:MAG: Asp23/Gls24 family envelope stress response protein [Lawsonibacter sp.]|nr:Asp23/Gls24 family envelope stress response protein [Lawsonibacter sp.]